MREEFAPDTSDRLQSMFDALRQEVDALRQELVEIKQLPKMPVAALTASYRGHRTSLRFDAETGHGHFDPMPSPELLRTYYAEDYPHDGRGPAEIFTPELINILRGVMWHVQGDFGHPKTFRYHDAGCGMGGSVWAMQQLGMDASGNDVFAPGVAVGNAWCGDRLIAASIEEAMKQLSDIDLMFCAHVLEHLLDPQAAIDAMAQALAPNGLAYLCVPNARSYRAAKFGLADCPYFAFPMHLHYFTQASLCSMIRKAGLTPIAVETRPMNEPPEVRGELTIHERCERMLGGELFVLARKT